MLHTKKRSEASLSDDYQTPRDLFLHLCEEYDVDPQLDVCADARNNQCVRHLTEHDDALKKEWSWNAWCNPPHSKTGAFVEKAYEQWRKNNIEITMIIPANTISSNYWHEFIEGNAEYHPIRGRIKFLTPNALGNYVVSDFVSRNAYICVIFRQT